MARTLQDSQNPNSFQKLLSIERVVRKGGEPFILLLDKLFVSLFYQFNLCSFI